MTPQRVEDTKIATAEDLSGHMNKDYTFPNVRAMGGKMRPADDNWQLKEPVVIQDISAFRTSLPTRTAPGPTGSRPPTRFTASRSRCVRSDARVSGGHLR